MNLKNTLLLILFLGLSFTKLNAQNSLTATDIIKKADELTRGKTNSSEMVVDIIRPTWKRSISIKSWGKGLDYSMTYVTAPAQDRGQVFLKLKTDMWNWMPSIGRMIKIPASMMSQGWMGSDYTNDDILKESSMVVDYNHKIIGEDTIQGLKTYKIEMTPKPTAAVVWNKVYKWITEKGFIQIKSEYYDEDNTLVKSEFGYDFKTIDGRLIPTRIEIVPADNSGKKTVVHIKNMHFNIKLSESFFSQQNMKRVH
jgi:outer membrane lipoprotein-sorting protein